MKWLVALVAGSAGRLPVVPLVAALLGVLFVVNPGARQAAATLCGSLSKVAPVPASVVSSPPPFRPRQDR